MAFSRPGGISASLERWSPRLGPCNRRRRVRRHKSGRTISGCRSGQASSAGSGALPSTPPAREAATGLEALSTCYPRERSVLRTPIKILPEKQIARAVGANPPVAEELACAVRRRTRSAEQQNLQNYPRDKSQHGSNVQSVAARDNSTFRVMQRCGGGPVGPRATNAYGFRVVFAWPAAFCADLLRSSAVRPVLGRLPSSCQSDSVMSTP
jgi:hypothetical protein